MVPVVLVLLVLLVLVLLVLALLVLVVVVFSLSQRFLCVAFCATPPEDFYLCNENTRFWGLTGTTAAPSSSKAHGPKPLVSDIDESMSKDSCPVIQSTVSRTICGQVRRSPAIATGRKLAGGLC